MTSERAWFVGVAVIVVLTLFAGGGDARTKSDVLRLENGDTLTCEIKEMQQGLVSVKASYLKGIVVVKWVHVDRIESPQLFEIELTDGSRHFGSIVATDADLTMTVVTGLGEVDIPHHEVVRIAPIDESFWKRLRGNVDLGISAKKANDERQFNITGRASYRTRRYRLLANLNSFASWLGETQSTERHDFGIAYRRALKNKWFWSVYTKLEHNLELGLDLRTTLAGGGGRFIVQNSTSELSWTTGVAGNQEWYVEASDPQTNIEGFVLLEYRLFLFGGRETSVSISGVAMPSFSTSGRTRYSFDAKYRHELIKNLYFAVGLIADYDSRPPTEASREDWNFTTSLGYSF